jgi:hypothetical protein
MYLQVPLRYGWTQAPSIPEFHADNTQVFFNFGWDLTDQLCDAGFTTTVLVTREYFEMLNQSTSAPASNGDGFDVEELVIAVRPQSLTPVTDSNVSRVFGFLPAFHYATWECIKPN